MALHPGRAVPAVSDVFDHTPRERSEESPNVGATDTKVDMRTDLLQFTTLNYPNNATSETGINEQKPLILSKNDTSASITDRWCEKSIRANLPPARTQREIDESPADNQAPESDSKTPQQRRVGYHGRPPKGHRTCGEGQGSRERS